MNVKSKVLGRKDIIKIEDTFDVNMDLLGLIDKNITVNIIKDGILIEKKFASVPATIKGGIKCQNPRCISHTDDYAVPTFTLVKANGKLEYECSYCEEISIYRF
jgi:aspartate carbamoyltransferase regulatory subunit